MKGFKQVLHSVTEEEVDASFETLATYCREFKSHKFIG